MNGLQATEKVLALISNFKKIFIYSSDPGAYNCLYPIHSALSARNIDTTWVYDGWCRRTVPGGADCVDLNGFEKYIEANDDMAKKICIIIGQQLDSSQTYTLLKFCKRKNIYSIFFVDHWWINRENFVSKDSGGKTYLPDKICVMDENVQKRIMRDLKGDIENNAYFNNIHIVGHPGVENSVIAIKSISDDDIKAYRKSLDAESKKIILFLLEPLAEDFKIKKYDKEYLGYTEYTVMDHFFNNFDLDNCVVILKPHPRQNINDVTEYISKINHKYCIIEQEKRLEFLIATSDEVIGITTIGLVIALFADKPVKSLQVGRNKRGIKLSNHYLEKHLVI